MKRVLFVDDEPHIREGLKRMLFRQRKEWLIEFAASGREALDILARAEVDVLVTDIRMPEMDGVALLSEVTRLYPKMVRIVLSGTADQELTLRSVSLAHQYLIKPCEAPVVHSAIERAFELRNRLDDQALAALIGRIRSLPSLPTVYTRLVEMLQSENVTASQIGRVVSQDLGMAAKVLQLANSPLFGTRRVICTPVEATIYLGVETVKALALSESVFSQFGPHHDPGFSPSDLCAHSVEVAALSRRIAVTWQLPPSVIDDVFLGGLLHDVGKLVLGSNFPGQYREISRNVGAPEAVYEHERRLFGASHAEVGGYLIWLWGVPGQAAEIVARHHVAKPEPGGKIEPAAAVFLADRIVRGTCVESDCENLASLRLSLDLGPFKGENNQPVVR